MSSFLARTRHGSFGSLLVVFAMFGVFASGAVLAQVHFGSHADETMASVALPDTEPFCAGDPCPNQTCDEVNRRCVGNATLQPPMGAPLLGLSPEALQRFELGAVAFDHDISIPEGLGPTFNQTACGSCHITPLGGSGSITVNRFGLLDYDTLVFDPLAELGGSLQQAEAISPECEEELPFPPANTFAQRLTNSTLGFGLVEAIPDADLLFHELNPPSPAVSGRARLVNPLESPSQTRVGRFGWKAQVATVLTFSGDAALNEMGLTNRLVPHENAPNGDEVLLASCDPTPDPEDVPDSFGVEFIDRVTDFQRLLAPPPQTPRSGMTGEQLFALAGCADCHVSSFTTADDEDDDEFGDLFRNKVIHPYSDFLVHDMGAAGDFIGDGPVGALELRTPPLWGVRQRDPLWHDGRVAGGDLAFRILIPGGIIDQHDADGSEARISAQAFQALTSVQKDQVVAFLDSLGRREFDMDGDGVVNSLDQASAQSCAAVGGPFTPDAFCAVADVNQDGDVDADDLALLDVALGMAVDGDDENGDEGDDEEGFPFADQAIPATEGAEEMDADFSSTHEAQTPSTAGTAPAPQERNARGKAAASGRPSHRGL